MSDIIERMKEHAKWETNIVVASHVLMDDARDEIERLLKDVHRLTKQRDYYLHLAHDLCRDEGQELTDDMLPSEVNDE